MELEMRKKLFKGWTASFEGWSEVARWTEEDGRQAGEASAQVDIVIEAERRFWGLAALELNGVKLMAKPKKKKLGSGKPYDKRSEKEAALNVPVVVGWRGGGGTDQG